MNIPGYSADVSIYRSTMNSDCQMEPVQFSPLRPLPNGSGGYEPAGPPPQGCWPKVGPCVKDPSGTCKDTGYSRHHVYEDCSEKYTCCPAPPCDVTWNSSCTGGQCNAYPNCGPVPGSGTQTGTDCHGNKTTRPC